MTKLLVIMTLALSAKAFCQDSDVKKAKKPVIENARITCTNNGEKIFDSTGKMSMGKDGSISLKQANGNSFKFAQFSNCTVSKL